MNYVLWIIGHFDGYSLRKITIFQTNQSSMNHLTESFDKYLFKKHKNISFVSIRCLASLLKITSKVWNILKDHYRMFGGKIDVNSWFWTVFDTFSKKENSLKPDCSKQFVQLPMITLNSHLFYSFFVCWSVWHFVRTFQFPTFESSQI